MHLNSRPRLLFLSYFALLLFIVASSAALTGPVMPLYVKSLGIDIVGWSLLASALWFGFFVAEWAWGSLGDTHDRRILMLLSAMALCILSPLFTLRLSFPIFMILMFITGALMVSFGPLTRSYVTTESPKRSIGFYTSLWWAFLVMGRVAGPLLGSYIAATWAFTDSFWLTSAMALALFLFILTSFPSDRHKRPHKQNLAQSLKEVMRRRPSQLLFLSAMLYFMAPTLALTFLPLYAVQESNMSTIEVGILVASISAAELISMPIIGYIADRYGRRRTIVVGLLASFLLFLLYFVARSSTGLFLVSMGTGVAFAGTSLLLAMIPDVTPSRMYGAAVGVFGSFEDLGTIVGPLLFGFVWATFGPIYIFAVTSVTQLAAAFLVLKIPEAGNQ